MASATDAPVDLYIAAYADPDAARSDWDAIKQLAEGRHDQGRRAHPRQPPLRRQDPCRRRLPHGPQGRRLGRGRRRGHRLDLPAHAAGGCAVGAGVGAGVGALVSHGEKEEIKAEVEDTLPLNSSGIVAFFEEQWADDIDKALSKASNVTKEQVDGDSAARSRPRRRRTSPLRRLSAHFHDGRPPPGGRPRV